MATAIEPQVVPPLAFGDKLSGEEFLRRWEVHPEILERNMPQVLARLQEGLNSPEHRALVKELALKRKS